MRMSPDPRALCTGALRTGRLLLDYVGTFVINSDNFQVLVITHVLHLTMDSHVSKIAESEYTNVHTVKSRQISILK